MKRFIEYIAEEIEAYHGSGGRFSKFSADHARVANDHMGGGVGYFTSDKDVSKTYARSMAKTTKGEPHIYHTTLHMKNVFDVDHEFTGDKLKNILPDDHEAFARGAGLLNYGSDKYKVLNDIKSGKAKLSGMQVFKGLSKGNTQTAKAREHLKSKGYDGLRYNGGDNMNTKRHDVYIPYHPDSITINKVTKLVKKAK
jgi:ADP-Ribosyltransferase in polyvalent proteins